MSTSSENSGEYFLLNKIFMYFSDSVVPSGMFGMYGDTLRQRRILNNHNYFKKKRIKERKSSIGLIYKNKI